MEKKLYAEIEVGEEYDLLDREQFLMLMEEEFDRVSRLPEEKTETELGYGIIWKWLTKEEYEELKPNP